jgi:4-phytase / acid phosphatase
MKLLLQTLENRPSMPCPRAVIGGYLVFALTSLLLGLANATPVKAQTTNMANDGTILKQTIIFGRHGIRASTDDTNTLDQYSANPYPAFSVPPGYLTTNGQRAAVLLGSYFREYLIHEGLLTGNPDTDLARSYFRANTIERSYMTAAKFGSGLITNVSLPVHTFSNNVPDPVFDPILAQVAAVDPVRAVTEVQGVFGSGTNLESAYCGELSLISKVLYPAGTQPINSSGPLPTTNAPQGSYDPTALPITLTNSSPISITVSNSTYATYYTGDIIDMGGLNATISAADAFVMQYADGFPINQVGWGRFTLASLSQQTRINTLQIGVEMRQPYLAKVQSSNAGSHVLRTLEQAIGGKLLGGAFGDPQSQALVVVSSDYYVAGLAGLLGLHWCLPGYQPDFCAPGGALVFELRQVTATEQYIIRVFYTAQTFDQLRNLTPLTLTNPPATMQLLIPGCGNSATNLDVNFIAFSNLLTGAIGLEYVESFSAEGPGLLDPYAADNPTNILASVSGSSLSLVWPDDHLGWILQAKTNGLGTGLWYDLPGTGEANSAAIPINPANPAVFYRLRKPF